MPSALEHASLATPAPGGSSLPWVSSLLSSWASASNSCPKARDGYCETTEKTKHSGAFRKSKAFRTTVSIATVAGAIHVACKLANGKADHTAFLQRTMMRL